jgi:metallo-beta-lactamase family protein
VLKEVVRRTVDRGGKVLVPAFNLGRSQIVVHYVQHWMRRGELPNVPLYMDSPLAADITEVHRLYPDLLAEPFRQEVANPLARYIRESRESRELSNRPGPCILVASGGMCEAGRIVNHLEHNVDDPRCTILLVSYQAPGSLGRKLLDRGPTVRFRGRSWNKWAEVVDLNGFSGHADQADLRNFFRPLRDRPPHVCLVHGEPEQAHPLAAALRADGFPDITVPKRGDSVPVGRERAASA